MVTNSAPRGWATVLGFVMMVGAVVGLFKSCREDVVLMELFLFVVQLAPFVLSLLGLGGFVVMLFHSGGWWDGF